MDKMKFVKAKLTPEFKEKVKAFADSKGETEATIVRKALLKYVNPAPK